jgi:hypothetical protein
MSILSSTSFTIVTGWFAAITSSTPGGSNVHYVDFRKSCFTGVRSIAFIHFKVIHGIRACLQDLTG